MQPSSDRILVKRYAGSRLYDTKALRDVTVADLRRWQLLRIPFVVRDDESGDDITRVVLAHA